MRNYSYAEALTPSDTVDAAHVIEAFVPGTTGNVAAVLLDGTAVTIAVTVGTVYPLRCRRINATNTTSTGTVGLGDKVRTVEALGAGQTIGL